jgi:hypothetical protein
MGKWIIRGKGWYGMITKQAADKITQDINARIRSARPSYKRYYKRYYGAAIREGRKLLFWESEPLFLKPSEAIARAREIQKAGFISVEA